MEMPRVVHFEIPADDPERAVRFYQEVFGWTSNRWDGPEPYWLITTGDDSQPGINGGIMRKHHPEQPLANTIDVPSVDEFSAKIEAAGGQVVLPKMAVPGIGWLAYFKDTEGNVSGIMEMDPSAA
jgi:uncharacterized protein